MIATSALNANDGLLDGPGHRLGTIAAARYSRIYELLAGWVPDLVAVGKLRAFREIFVHFPQPGMLSSTNAAWKVSRRLGSYVDRLTAPFRDRVRVHSH